MDVQVFRDHTTFNNIKGDELEWLNFKGKRNAKYAKGLTPEQLATPGDRSFDIVITRETAELLFKLGWRMKIKGRYKHGDKDDKQWQAADGLDDDRFGELKYSIKVHVSYRYPTYVYRIVEGANKKRLMTPDAPDWGHNISSLDSEMFVNAKVIVTTSKSPNDGLISAYLQQGYFEVLDTGEANDRYSSMPLEGEDEVEDEDFEQ